MKCDFCKRETSPENLQTFSSQKGCSQCIDSFLNGKHTNKKTSIDLESEYIIKRDLEFKSKFSKFKKCLDCEKEFSKKAKACPHCGRLTTPQDESHLKTLPVFFLCFLFGLFGAHRFYVRKTKTAILQLLFFVLILFTQDRFLIFVVPGIWATIDLITIITGNFTDIENKKIKSWT